MKRVTVLAVLLFAALVMVTAPAPLVAQGYCIGLKGLKPLVPIGCRDLVPMCVCDDTGGNCGWRWVCVKY